jgi:hypothetical protein
MEKKSKRGTRKTNSNKTSTKKTLINKPIKNRLPKKLYLGFGNRLLINIILFVLFLTLTFFAASKTIEREKVKPINYSDIDNIAYKVYLVDNDIYKEKFLGMNRAYVANLIDYVDIDFNYVFSIEKLTNMKFDYKIIAELIIENNKGTNYVDEKYILKDTQLKELKNSGTLSINENVKIDYKYYNELANKFKTQTGVNINSYLKVFMIINKSTTDNLNYRINDISNLSIRIPLSERALEINIDSDSRVTEKQVYPKSVTKFNVEYLVIEIVSFVIMTIYLIKVMNLVSLLIKKKTKYDKFVNKILKDYDRLIVESKTDISFDNCNIIEVKSFTELLDVRDNLKLPIIYYNIVAHQKGLFYIKNNIDVYRLIIKDVDLEKKPR